MSKHTTYRSVDETRRLNFNMDIGYKVVCRISDKYISSSQLGKARKRYFVNRFVERCKNFGPLCLFKTKTAAIAYISYLVDSDVFCDFRVFKSEYIPSKDKALWDECNVRLTYEDLTKHYPVIARIKKADILFAEKIKLLKIC